jgi:hypothetical protein
MSVWISAVIVCASRVLCERLLCCVAEGSRVARVSDTRERGRWCKASNAGLAYGVGWGLLTRTSFGPAFFKEGHGDGAQNYMICFEQRQACMILPTNSDNGELAFRALLEKLWGDTVTPWEWEGYTATYIDASRKLK